ncbi:DNA polymerase iota [Pelodytes ibericus]
MACPREMEEEEETDWLFNDGIITPSSLSQHPAQSISNSSELESYNAASKVIIHIDMDCFYAQVEMIRNPDLKDKPLGVQQKNIVVTCNYVARRFGVDKLMYIKDAKEKCPQLVLVSGEDLTHYREISYKATELLEEFSPKVERLGFDENFIDVTELVDNRLGELRQTDAYLEVSVSGHVYDHQTVNMADVAHLRIAVGSHIAAEIRAALRARLDLTGCAGVAASKLLSKLVSGTHKPNQQTVLLPESSTSLINSLNHVKKLPGIGYKTAQRLESMNLSSIPDLQACPLSVLEKAFGKAAAQRMQMLSRGQDNSPVTPSGPPQSLSDEDSFKKCSTVLEVKMKMEELLGNLLKRLSKDGRRSHTLRLTIRQYSPTNKWFNRESRQCPIPSHVIQHMGADDKDIISPLTELLMKLFEKMIDVKMPFHLTLMNVCFSNLKASSSSRNSMGFYLTRKNQTTTTPSRTETEVGLGDSRPQHRSGDFFKVEQRNVPESPPTKETDNSCAISLPDGIDMDVFSQLPEDIRNEILRSPSVSTTQKKSRPPLSSKGILNFFSRASVGGPSASTDSHVEKTSAQEHLQVPLQNNMEVTEVKLLSSSDAPSPYQPAETSKCVAGESAGTSSSLSNATWDNTMSTSAQYDDTAMDCTASGGGEGTVSFPKNVDQKVFSELPIEVQKEFLSEWKQQNHTSKIQTKKQNKKSNVVQGKKSQPPKRLNSLLKYFKPS